MEGYWTRLLGWLGLSSEENAVIGETSDRGDLSTNSDNRNPQPTPMNSNTQDADSSAGQAR